MVRQEVVPYMNLSGWSFSLIEHKQRESFNRSESWLPLLGREINPLGMAGIEDKFCAACDESVDVPRDEHA